MKKIILLLAIILIGCSGASPKATSVWDLIDHTEVQGIVEITTGWGKSPLCTGSLISENVVVTAAHCAIFPAEDMFIVYGCNEIDGSDCTRREVKKAIKHPNWKKKYTSNDDIALMIPKEPITDLKPIEVVNRQELEEGLPIRAAGFGRRYGGSGVLYSGKGRITRDYEYEFVAHFSGNLDPNPGDSGGPALLKEDGKFKLTGTLSRSRWGSLDKRKVFVHSGYATYTKIRPYMEWIHEVTYNAECKTPQ